MNLGNFIQRAILPPSVRTSQYQRQAIVGSNAVGNYHGVGGTMMAEWDAGGAVRNAYMANVIVYRCVQLIAETIAAIPFRAGKDPLKPTEYNPDAQLARLLGPPPGGPNPDTTPSALWANAIAQYLVTGRFGWEIEWSGNTVVALWPLMAQYLTGIPASSGTQYFSGFEYRVGGERRELSPKQCFYEWRPSLHDWHQPESPLQSARLDIAVAVLQDVYDRAFLQNDARPAAMVITQKFASDEQFRGFKDEYNGEFGGPVNAGKPIFVEVDTEDGDVTKTIDIQQLGLSQRDAESIKRYEQKVKAICIALGVPLSKLDASGRTFDNASEEDKTFWLNTILPILNKVQEAVNIRLAPLVGNEVGWFDLSNVKALQRTKNFLPIDPILLWKEGGIRFQELRDAAGVDPDPDVADHYYQPPPLEEVPAPIIDSPPPEPLAIGTGETKSAFSAEGIIREIESQRAKQEAKAVVLQRELSEEERHTRRRQTYSVIESQVTVLEQHWEKEFKRLFERQASSVQAQLKGKRARRAIEGFTREDPILPDGGAVFDREFWRQNTESTTTGLYEAVLAQSAGRIIAQLGIDFSLSAPHVTEFINARANRLAGLVTDTTYKRIQKALTDGVLAGEGIDDIAKRVQSVFDAASTYRATTIARTEVIGAYNGGSHLVAKNLPVDVVGGMEWIATLDSRVRESHSEADGQIVRVGEKFALAGYSLEYPGDPSAPPSETIQCRCSIAPVVPEDMPDYGRAKYRSVKEVEQQLVAIAMGTAA